MSESLAPIVLFAHKRPQHLRRAIEALLANELASRSKLYVFCDAAKNESDRAAVDEVRDFVDTLQGFRSREVIHREQNLGLARSVISGVTAVLNEHTSAIVVEDDLVTSPHFLKYMNTSLCLYSNEERVASIHGYVYPVEKKLPETFFLRGADCWGWATWSRAWAKFNASSETLLNTLEDRSLTRRFDMDGTYAFSQMLRDHIAGKNDSWAVRWHASAFLEDMLTLYPARSLVENIGLDASGTHCGPTKDFGGTVGVSRVDPVKLRIREHQGARRAFVEYFRNLDMSHKPIDLSPALPSPSPGIRGWLQRQRDRSRFRRLKSET